MGEAWLFLVTIVFGLAGPSPAKIEQEELASSTLNQDVIVQAERIAGETEAAGPGSVDESFENEIRIPALTVVELGIDADLGSKISKTGETFPIYLVAPITVDDREVVPAGTVGYGEIVHAKKASGMGAAGELVLAARYLNLGDRRLKLRSMRLVVIGQDSIYAVDSYNAAAAGASVFTPLPLGLLGFAITGKNILVPKGTVALAKTAEDFAMIFVPLSRDDVAQDDSQDLSSQEERD